MTSDVGAVCCPLIQKANGDRMLSNKRKKKRKPLPLGEMGHLEGPRSTVPNVDWNLLGNLAGSESQEIKTFALAAFLDNEVSYRDAGTVPIR